MVCALTVCRSITQNETGSLELIISKQVVDQVDFNSPSWIQASS